MQERIEDRRSSEIYRARSIKLLAEGALPLFSIGVVTTGGGCSRTAGFVVHKGPVRFCGGTLEED